MANQLNCLRCGTGMRFIRREKFQLGQTGWVLGDLPNLFAGAMEIEIYVCPKCGKLEFFQPGSDKFAGTADEAKTGSGYLPPTHRAVCRAKSAPSAGRCSTLTTAAARTVSTNSDSKL